ncbi:MAG: ABC transporter ATP-binding protein [Planctomycetales bacterium 71-10]|nr:MAG: ABC transporter ATP-binding protein [Planctomycetales bacterium 71-10]
MHRLYNAVKSALRNLTLHKLRVLLTILGLIFGVSSVIAMLAIAEGASAEAQRQIAELGATNIIARSSKPVDEVNPSKANAESFIFKYGLTYRDFDRIVETIPTVVGATAVREFPQSLRHFDREIEGRVVGVGAGYFALTNQKAAEGRFFGDADLFYIANVVVLGAEVAERLFPYGNPVGKSIRIGDQHYYRVVGVAADKSPAAGAGGTGSAGPEFNKCVYIPLTTDRARFGEILMNEKQGNFSAERLELSQITLTVGSMDQVKATADALSSMLTQFHPKKDFTITVPLELLEKAQATKRIFNLVLGSIASISLLVGGIGIMNIMLATVSERTREIGIRRALGAKRRDIIEQFLIETTVMSGSGGLIGVALGLAAPPLVARFSGIPVVVNPWSPIVAFLIAVLTGVVFGVYPARRAARLDPVEALRAE